MVCAMNILLITNIYPNNDPKYGGTRICHSFAKEWQAMKHNVYVVHFDSLFPCPYYWIGSLFYHRIQAKTGSVAYMNTPRRPQCYSVDGIPVIFVPLRKTIPHKAPSKRRTEQAFQYVVGELEKDGFAPDVVTAHFVLPQLQFLPLFKKKYPQARTCLVMHGDGGSLSYYYPNEYPEYMSSVDIWGFRSLAFQKDFVRRFGNDRPMFLCHSGIPEEYIDTKTKDFPNGVKRFVFVGSLFERKNVDIIIRALKKELEGRDYTFDIVGSGSEISNLHRLVDELEMKEHVVFHGRMTRDAAQQIIREADCFIMVSSREAFGLVYVEAMAKGCIVVGTEGQGIDGVVEHGVNGFLCKDRDVNELANLIGRIVDLPQSSLEKISSRAQATAAGLTDRMVAERYIKAVLSE